MLVLVRSKRYLKVIKVLGLDFHLPHLKSRVFKRCDQLYVQTLECRKELYTYLCEINTNQMLLIFQMMWIVTPSKEEKPNTYTYYKRAK